MSDAAASDWGWWRERRLPAERIHLDSAAAGRSSRATLAAAAAHAEREAAIGAYVAAAEAGPVLAEGQAGLGRLLGVPAAGVAFVPSAEAALDALLAIWPLREGDTVAVVPAEWGPNLHAFAARGLRITEIPVAGDGAAGLPGWAVADPPDAPSAIVALRAANGQDITRTRARLLGEHGIVVTAGAVSRAPRDMTEPLLRISPHVDCTPEDLARLRQALLTLA